MCPGVTPKPSPQHLLAVRRKRGEVHGFFVIQPQLSSTVNQVSFRIHLPLLTSYPPVSLDVAVRCTVGSTVLERTCHCPRTKACNSNKADSSVDCGEFASAPAVSVRALKFKQAGPLETLGSL